jgi:hypothetical protein
VDDDGTVFAWYHQEVGTACGSSLVVPRIGAAVSFDGGRTFADLGIILSSSDPADCSSQNGYFAGGHGDFSVVPDRERGYFYFMFTNYAGPLESQGVVVARMAAAARHQPLGSVWKYYNGSWDEAGVGGHVTPIFPARATWQQADTDSFWGPSVHWNTHLQKYVALLNRSCCESGFPQEGIYISFSGDLSDPSAWSEPRKIVKGGWWYPQVLGLGPGETDSLAGRFARLYIYGESAWELEFDSDPEPGLDAARDVCVPLASCQKSAAPAGREPRDTERPR